MATVKENLIAARALIDTPEKYQGEHTWSCSVMDAVAKSTASGRQFEMAPAALAKALPHGYGSTGGGTDYGAITYFGIAETTTHADVMALLDRAIAAQDGKP